MTPINDRFPLPTDNFVKGPPQNRGLRNLAEAPYAPDVIPLNDGSPLAENPSGRPKFIVE